ncbi:hypothetical protein [Candidatus Dactylopiibacterium carminicum]|nr:hypothetical protein [Candidatus Dactylopiibacterium carminicum]
MKPKTPILPAHDLARYDEEVLNASWLPYFVDPQTPLPAEDSHTAPSSQDPDDFIARIYLAQE